MEQKNNFVPKVPTPTPKLENVKRKMTHKERFDIGVMLDRLKTSITMDGADISPEDIKLLNEIHDRVTKGIQVSNTYLDGQYH